MINIEKQFKIDKSSPVPMYFQIKQEIIHSINSDVFNIGDQLPTELEFCEALKISRPTIRQAFQELINEGYITRKKAKGTFVSKPKVDGYFFKKLESYNEEMRSLGLTPKTKVIMQEIVHPNIEVQKVLQIDKDDSILKLVRLRYANDEEMVFVQTYVPLKIFPNINNEDFADNHTSLYEVFNKYGSPIAYVDRTIEAKNANQELAKLLSINENDAFYSISTIAYNDNDEPIEYSIANYRGDRNKFSIRLVKQ